LPQTRRAAGVDALERDVRNGPVSLNGLVVLDAAGTNGSPEIKIRTQRYARTARAPIGTARDNRRRGPLTCGLENRPDLRCLASSKKFNHQEGADERV